MVRKAPLGHDRAAAAHDPGHAFGCHRDIGEAHAGVDGEVVHPLLSLLDQRVAEDCPGQLLGHPADLLQRLIDRHGADRHGGVADDPFAGVVDVAPRGEIHDRVRAPAGRPHHLVDLGGDVRRHRRIADIGVDLDQEIAPDRHRFAFGMVDVVGDDRAAARDFAADEFGRDDGRDFRAPGLAVAHQIGGDFAAQVLALGDIFHFRRDDAAPGIVHLADVHARTRAQRPLDRVGELRNPARAVGAELAVILGPYLAAIIGLDIAARHDPVAAQLGEPGVDVDGGVGVGVGARGVVDAHRRLADLKIDLAHRDADARSGARADMDLATAPDRPGGNADFYR